jgi:hypothetical protein
MLPSHRYEHLTGILERYISRATASAMLKTVLDERGIVPEQMTPEDLIGVVEEVMIGLRLFCNPKRLPDLMIELAELCDSDDEDFNEPRSPRASSCDSKPDFS